MFGRFPLLLVPETDTKGDTPLVLFASLHGKMASRTLLSKIYEVKKTISYIFAVKKVLLLHTLGQKKMCNVSRALRFDFMRAMRCAFA